MNSTNDVSTYRMKGARFNDKNIVIHYEMQYLILDLCTTTENISRRLNSEHLKFCEHSKEQKKMNNFTIDWFSVITISVKENYFTADVLFYYNK